MKKRVLVTGGTKGIGLEVAKMMLDLDYQVIVAGRNFSNFPLKDNTDVEMIEVDLSNLEALPAFISKVGDIDVLINNAGYMQPKYKYDNYPEEEKEKLMNVDLHTPVELMNAFSVSMKKKKYGRIVNTASIAGQIGHPDVWYGIAKAGLINATKSYAKCLGADGIVVNCVAPSAAETDMQKDNDEARKKAFKAAVVTNRFAEPEEIAKPIVWLATECPEYINGITIDINNTSYAR
jgi:3-oxoacyl-[acyl-carrier protein] reductase